MLAESSAPELLQRAAGATESIRFSAEQLVCCLFLIYFLKLNKESRPRDSAPKPGRTQVSTDSILYMTPFLFLSGCRLLSQQKKISNMKWNREENSIENNSFNLCERNIIKPIQRIIFKTRNEEDFKPSTRAAILRF